MADGTTTTLLHRHLTTMRTALAEYLRILVTQEAAISAGDIDRLAHTMQWERAKVLELDNLGTIIRATEGETATTPRPEIDRLYIAVVEQHRRNRRLLAERKEEVGRRLEATLLPPRTRSVYRPDRGAGSMINVVL